MSRPSGRRAVARRTLLALGPAWALTACVTEDLGGVFLIVNKWDKPIFHGQKEIAPGSNYKYGIQGCPETALRLDDKDGRAVVTVDEWCAGLTLTVLGRDDFTLEDS
jgi:hypothetical protein